jgi:hypothetical protein
MQARVGMEASGQARWLENREGGHGPEAGGSHVWIWHKGWDYERLKSSVCTRDNPEIAMV